jgi:hypothetical protein
MPNLPDMLRQHILKRSLPYNMQVHRQSHCLFFALAPDKFVFITPTLLLVSCIWTATTRIFKKEKKQTSEMRKMMCKVIYNLRFFWQLRYIVLISTNACTNNERRKVFREESIYVHKGSFRMNQTFSRRHKASSFWRFRGSSGAAEKLKKGPIDD